MSALIGQIILPLALGLMMFSMGLSLSMQDFSRVFSAPKAILVGVLLQLIALPILAWGIILSAHFITPLSGITAAGLLILAACPGGASSNIISHLSGGNGALSISMTAIVSVLLPFLLPFSLALQLSWLNTSSAVELHFPVLKTWLQLFVVTVIPVVIAMLLRARFLVWVLKYEALIARLSAALLFALVCLLVFIQWPQLSQQAWHIMGLCALMCLLAMGLAWLIARFSGFDSQVKKTLAIEVGIQNAGTGMFVALVVLKRPELALIPLSYGLMMNIPALAFVLSHQFSLAKKSAANSPSVLDSSSTK